MGGSRGRWVVAMLAVASAAGCAGGGLTPDEERRLEEIRQDGEALHQAADDLEDRMLADQANLQLWQELAARHKRVSAIATQNATEHFAAMVRMMERQEEKARKLKRRHYAEAEGEGEEAGGGGRQYLSQAGSTARARTPPSHH